MEQVGMQGRPTSRSITKTGGMNHGQGVISGENP
jgi:hypothetical protein